MENHVRAGLSPHLFRAFPAFKAVGGDTVYEFNLISAPKAGACRGRAFVGLVDNDVPVDVRLVDDGPDASVGTCEHHLEVFLLLFRNVHGIWIQRIQHGVHGGALNASHLQGIHVGTVKFLKDGIMDFYPFTQRKLT